MKKNAKLMLACLLMLPVTMMVTSCSETTEESCANLNMADCKAAAKCRYLTDNDGLGLCLDAKAKETTCGEVPPNLCGVANYIAGKTCKLSADKTTCTEVLRETPPRTDCELITDKDVCAAKTGECRYLNYIGGYKPGQGKCVAYAVPKKVCSDLSRDSCSLENFLSTKCRPTTGGPIECEVDEIVGLGTPTELFLFSAGFPVLVGNAVDTEIVKFNTGFERLASPVLKKELADMKDVGTDEFLFHRLAATPVRASSFRTMNTLLGDVNFVAQLNKATINGATPIMVLTGPGRTGDDVAEYKQAVKLFVDKGSDLTNLPASNVELFLMATDAITNKESPKNLYVKMAKNEGQLTEWIKFLLNNANDVTAAAFKESADADAPNKASLIKRLLTMAATEDLAGTDGISDRLAKIITNADKWFDLPLNGNFNFGQGGDAPLPVALATLINHNNGINPWSSQNTDYLRSIVMAMKPRVTTWDTYANPLIATLQPLVGNDTPRAKWILDLETVTSVWDAVKNLDLSVPENLVTMSNQLQIAINNGADFIYQLLTKPGSLSSDGLPLISRLVEKVPLSETEPLLLTMLTALSPEQRSQVMLMKREVPSVRAAIVDLFLRDPGDSAALGAIATVLSTGLTDGAMLAPLVDYNWRKLKTINFADDNERKDALTRINPVLPGTAYSLKQFYERALVLKQEPTGQGIIHMLLDGKGPINQEVAGAFNQVFNMLDDPGKKAWVDQVFDGKNALSLLLSRGIVAGDDSIAVKVVFELILSADPTFLPGDVDLIWPKLDNVNFADDVQRKPAMVILKAVTATKDKVGGKALINALLAKRNSTNTVRNAQIGLVESLPAGPIDGGVVSFFGAAMAAQATPDEMKAVLDQDVAGGALLDITDGTPTGVMGTAGSRIGEIVIAGDQLAQVKKLLTLFIVNNANLDILFSGNEMSITTRLMAIYSAILADDPTGATFVPFIKNADAKAIPLLASWATEAPGRAAAIKAVMTNVDPAPTYVARKIKLNSEVFIAALDGDIATVVRNNEPSGRVGRYIPPLPALTYLYINRLGFADVELKRFKLLMDNLDAFGLRFTKDSHDFEFDINRNNVDNTGVKKVFRGSLIWMLTAVIANNNAVQAIPLNRAKALVKTVSHKAARIGRAAQYGLQTVITAPVDWSGYIAAVSVAKVGVDIGKSAIQVVTDLGATSGAQNTPAYWLEAE